MADQWFYRMRGKQYGPIPFKRLKELCGLGIVEPDTEVREESMRDWLSADHVPELEMGNVAGSKNDSSFWQKPTTERSHPISSPSPSHTSPLDNDRGNGYRKTAFGLNWVWLVAIALVAVVALLVLRFANWAIFGVVLLAPIILGVCYLASFPVVADFFSFRTMIVPHIISAIFILACIGSAIIGASIWQRDEILGITVIIVGTFVSRLFCEYLVVHFRINNTLTELKNDIRDIRSSQSIRTEERNTP